MDVAVIIPVWNRASILGDTLDAIAAQTTAPRTVVVVDDGSTDDSAGVAESHARVDRVVRTEHKGLGHARNRGFEAVEPHAFLHFLDSDDLLPPDFYTRMQAVFDGEPAVQAASTDQRYRERDGTERSFRSLAGIERDPLAWFSRRDGGMFSTTCLRGELFETFGPFVESFDSGVDFKFLVDAADRAVWRHVPGEPVRYRREGDNVSRSHAKKAIHWASQAERLFADTRLPWWRRRFDLARRWRSAGNLALHQGDRALARRCYARAVRICPYFLTGYRKLIKTLVAPSP
ncbi:MAG: glycosyltransferase [Planctomycetota bacterium]